MSEEKLKQPILVPFCHEVLVRSKGISKMNNSTLISMRSF